MAVRNACREDIRCNVQRMFLSFQAQPAWERARAR